MAQEGQLYCLELKGKLSQSDLTGVPLLKQHRRLFQVPYFNTLKKWQGKFNFSRCLNC